MTVLVVGASGATGRLVVEQLLNKGIEVRAIIRTLDAIPDRPNLHKIQANVHDLTQAEMVEHIKNCIAVVSCLGHNLSFKGIFGQPKLLVTDTIACICGALQSNKDSGPVKIILMNTTGNSNRDIPEVPPMSQRIIIAMLRGLLPPHVDNERAADFLRNEIGQNNQTIEWVAVRPDGLINEDSVTDYDVYESPIRNVIFDAGTTSRINVANFMAELVVNKNLWSQWKGKMPVIYNQISN